MRKIFCLLSVCVITLLVSCADYDEGLEVVNFDVKLEFPSTYDGSYEGLRVELQDAVASTFVDSTDTQGMAHFSVPSGLYKVSSSARKETVDYRYFFNGAKSQVVVAVDSPRVVTLPLVMSKKRIVN
ncbi:hypothetical protein [Prevotella jejuni]|uniref:hypothetical protein n=1 Tax=Prevotella jejuni TaxID=1177574 RepID=UPI001BAB656A|nr:hypothetical protein [Prevotella jejuni]QUB78111.1 hypothetical protein J4857_00330 [Prevotella jejuni]